MEYRTVQTACVRCEVWIKIITVQVLVGIRTRRQIASNQCGKGSLLGCDMTRKQCRVCHARRGGRRVYSRNNFVKHARGNQNFRKSTLLRHKGRSSNDHCKITTLLAIFKSKPNPLQTSMNKSLAMEASKEEDATLAPFHSFSLGF